MKILALSDSHNYGYPIEHMPDADMLIHAGDSCLYGTDDELVDFSNWLDHVAAKYEHVLYVPGNHDKTFNGPGFDEIGRSICEKATVLINESTRIGGFSFYGSPVTPPIGKPWYYYMDEAGRHKHWNDVANQKIKPDVLITHSPAYRIADKVHNNWHRWPYVGCKHLRQYIEESDPALHVFGHIHETYGVGTAAQWGVEGLNGRTLRTTFVNASIRDEHYSKVNTPVLITLEHIEGKAYVTSAQPVKHWRTTQSVIPDFENFDE